MGLGGVEGGREAWERTREGGKHGRGPGREGGKHERGPGREEEAIRRMAGGGEGWEPCEMEREPKGNSEIYSDTPTRGSGKKK